MLWTVEFSDQATWWWWATGLSFACLEPGEFTKASLVKSSDYKTAASTAAESFWASKQYEKRFVLLQ